MLSKKSPKKNLNGKNEGQWSEKSNIFLKKFHFKGKAHKFKVFLKVNFKYLIIHCFLLSLDNSKEKLPFEYNVSLEFDNIWFMDFKYINNEERSKLNLKYNVEILKSVQQIDNKTQDLLEKYLSKVLKQNFSKKDYQNPYCLKVKDLFQTKKLSFGVILNKISLNELEFRLNIKKSLFEEFLNFHNDLITYLQQEVIDQMFTYF